MGFLDPKTLFFLFPGNGDSGPVWGRGNPNDKVQMVLDAESVRFRAYLKQGMYNEAKDATDPDARERQSSETGRADSEGHTRALIGADFLEHVKLMAHSPRAPQSAHHPHKSHDEHRQCNPGGGIHFAVLLGSDNSYTTPFEIPFLIRSLSWWRYMVGGPLSPELLGL